MSRNDIQISGNSIGGRQGWAYICNSGKFAVLKADLEKKQEYLEYREYCKARLAWEYDGKELYDVVDLAFDTEHGDARWEFTGGGACLSARFGYSDAMELIESANLPIVRKDDIVAIASFTSTAVMLKLYKVGKIDKFCIVRTVLTPLTDEEMNEVKKDADRWCR